MASSLARRKAAGQLPRLSLLNYIVRAFWSLDIYTPMAPLSFPFYFSPVQPPPVYTTPMLRLLSTTPNSIT